MSLKMVNCFCFRNVFLLSMLGDFLDEKIFKGKGDRKVSRFYFKFLFDFNDLKI